MDPTVVAAWIAAGVSVLTLVGTLAAQYFGRRGTSKDTKEALQEQWKQLDRTLREQRTRTLNERFATAAGQLGDDKPAAVRLAGVYAMAGLADDWEENRQTCIDVLCAYLRIPYESDPGQNAPEPQRLSFQAIREVRHTVIRVITSHLKDDAEASWQGRDFDFTGVVFDGGDFAEARFAGGRVNFIGARFTKEWVSFRRAKFSGGIVSFEQCEFSGGRVTFQNSEFSGSTVFFALAEFSGGQVDFESCRFSGGVIQFIMAEFSGGTVDFRSARFSSSAVGFEMTTFSGGTVDFSRAQFSGGEVDFSDAYDWSHPPIFDWDYIQPNDVLKLPR